MSSEAFADTELDDEDIPPLNTVHLVGRTGNEPEATYFENGSVVVKVSLAVRRQYNPLQRKLLNMKYGDEPTDWFPLEIWGSNGEYVRNYVRKGFRIGVVGELAIDHWQDKNTGEDRSRPKIYVRSVEILQSRSENDASSSAF